MKRIQSFLLLVSFSFTAFHAFSQTYSFISTGDMEFGGWTAVPKNTNLVATFDPGTGIDNTQSLKLITTSVVGDPYYILRAEQLFHMTSGEPKI